jgi:hypothetical protein
MNERTKTGPNCKGSLPKATGKKLPRVIPGYRGTAIHQDDACVAPTIAAFIDGPCRGEACLALVPSCIPFPRDCIVRPRTGISFLTRLFDNDP